MSNDHHEIVMACAQVLADHNGQDTVVLDLTGLSIWTDYFVVTTATSTVHLGGLVRHLSEHLTPGNGTGEKAPAVKRRGVVPCGCGLVRGPCHERASPRLLRTGKTLVPGPGDPVAASGPEPREAAGGAPE